MGSMEPPMPETLKVDPLPRLDGGTLLIAFTGWMDGGDVSTGTVRRLIEHLGGEKVGCILPEPYYVYNMPGNMEVAALFRPHTKIRRGLLQAIDMPRNDIYVSNAEKLVMFVGEEPNLRWEDFAQCLLAVARQTAVQRIFFIGSFAGSVPHTREPRLFATISDRVLQPMLQRHGVRPSSYEGPGSFATYLLARAPQEGIEMATLVAEIPAYVEGPNPMSIEAVTRRLASMLELPMDLAPLRSVSDAWESQISQAIEEDPDLAGKIKKLEDQYDQDLLKSQEVDPWEADEEEDPGEELDLEEMEDPGEIDLSAEFDDEDDEEDD
jgi:proteasome assembly chaperone (PAC2) family protein